MSNGIFVAFEGCDGAGKSTQLKAVYDILHLTGQSVITTRSPGGCPSAEKIRSLLMSLKEETISPISEMALFLAALREQYMQIIEPALQQDKIVLCDRFIHSTLAYQVHGYGSVARYQARQIIGNMITPRMFPNLVILFDIDPKEALRRIELDVDRSGSKTKWESSSFLAKVRKGYMLELMDQGEESVQYVVIDATLPPDTIVGHVLEAIDLYKRTGKVPSKITS